MARLLTLVAFFVLLLHASPGWADFSSLSSNRFTYCQVSAENYAGDSCSLDHLRLDWNCSLNCGVSGNHCEVAAFVWWQIEGEGESYEGDAIWTSAVSVQAERITAGTLRVQGDCVDYAGQPEISVFRFDGDPAVFDGTAVTTVGEFVELGLIDAEDVLLVHQCSYDDEFSHDVDVHGIPDEDLVLFAASPTLPGPGGPGGDGGVNVPAVSPIGTIVLTIVLLGMGAILLRRRVRA